MLIDDVKQVLNSTLQLGARTAKLELSTPLLGALPELDSMAVVSLIAALEDRFGIVVNDDEIGAEAFETLGALVRFVEQKLTEAK